MTPSDDKNRNPESASDSQESVVRIDASDESADLGTEMVEGQVAEVAGERASENKGDTTGKGSQTQTAQKKDDATADDRLALRERLLKSAPKAPAMRAQIIHELEQKKVALEADILKYQGSKEYHMWSLAIAQLRAVLRQIELVAHAGYEALREIWLKVVHKFA